MFKFSATTIRALHRRCFRRMIPHSMWYGMMKLTLHPPHCNFSKEIPQLDSFAEEELYISHCKILEISGDTQMCAIIWIQIHVRRYVDAVGRVLQLVSPLLRSDSYIRLRWEKSWTGIRSGTSSASRRDGWDRTTGVSRPGRITTIVTGASVRTWKIIQQKVISTEYKMRISRANHKTGTKSTGKQPVDGFSFLRTFCSQQERATGIKPKLVCTKL